MRTKKDYYEVLGVDRHADDNTLKRAYRKLAKKYHPDTNAGNAQAEERFKEVTEAYNVLSDSEKRKLYDRFGHAAFDQGGTESAGFDHNYQEFHGSFQNGFRSGSFYDIFDDDIEDIFRGSFGRDRFRQGGQDLEAEIALSFDEAVFGCDKIINPALSNLPGESGRSLKVHIPAGIDTGMSIRLKGKGLPGSAGVSGDLLLKVTVGSKPGFERRGLDVYTTLFLPFTTAVLGGEATVDTLYGKVLCKIAEGTQSGSRIRLKEKGIVSMKNSGVHGDQYVTVQIQVPKNLTEDAKKKLKEFEKSCTGKSRHAA